MFKRLMVLLALGLSLPASAEEQTLRFYGYAYDLSSGKYLYTEVHEQHAEGDRWTGGSITYVAPDGREMGRKTLSFSKDPYVPVYKLALVARGYTEAITGVGSRVDMAKRSTSSDPEERKSITKSGDMAADSGFHSYIRAHFAELMAGQTINFRMVVAGNLDSFKFRIKRIGDTRFEGKPAVQMRVEPDSLLRYLVDPLELTYEPTERKLLEYRGISNVHDPISGKAYTARIAYYSKPPADAPRSLPPLQ